ncbi:uncharacterized protein OCT59_000160 [Rhizophagus irregularis]|uniref:Uncharacterized protein n=2 Tax=Rhizophagus irregularis TaxID=588596 RepID=A0A2N1MQS8_9GLOM|nr:hypothetical protein RhiirC2_757436 [Rhizophagus irregularis]UZN98875.1 hypothetical protein OCT59_000160 [Rhizophagus irregularis]GBC49704.1 hypothetical protein GLOIN_2v1784816 [Rhizophagus irregularis DAOM 181602=DAOM 197198]
MEWQQIRTESSYMLSKEQGLGSLDQMKDWAMKHNNFLRMGHKSGEISQEYTTLRFHKMTQRQESYDR